MSFGSWCSFDLMLVSLDLGSTDHETVTYKAPRENAYVAGEGSQGVAELVA